MKDLGNHPCFNDKVRHKYARVHIPVAPKCNIQCGFCNRKYDCVNESRPGVSSVVLAPYQALFYVDKVVERKPETTVVGIAGPGDAFATPEETIMALRLIKNKYPEMLLCVATNGLDVYEYIDDLAEIEVSHVTITINSVDPEIGEKIYPWVRFKKKVYRGREAAEVLIKRQLEAVKKLKENGITVKINSIVIPGVNDRHIEEIAKRVSELEADILNALPIFPTEGTMFEDAIQPDVAFMQELRRRISKYIPQMHHCTRCRADAVGLLGENIKDDDINLLLKSSLNPLVPGEKRDFVAVASMEGLLVNRHLGEAGELFIYARKGDEDFELIERRKTPEAGGGLKRWKDLAEILSDCSAVFLSGIGISPKTVLTKSGIKIIETEGLISEVLDNYFKGKKINVRAKQVKCGEACTGTGLGCG